MSAQRPAVLCLASYFKGQRFLTRCRREGWHVILLTAESLLTEDWPRDQIDEVFALPTFTDRPALLKAISYLARTREIERVIALDDFDVEVAGDVREHLRLPGLNASTARLFRDKLAMRQKARDIGVRIPEFTGIFNHDRVHEFLSVVPAPWLLKPRSQASAAGIKKLHHADEVWREIERLGDEQSFFLLERFIPGDLYHVDSLVNDGRVLFAEVNGYLRPLLDVYQGGGTYATRTVPRERPEVPRLRAASEEVLTGFGLRRGASHTEFLVGHADGEIYLVETSARVGGANTAEMVEAATAVNLWEEWAAIELRGSDYKLPPLKSLYGGVVVSLAKQEWPDSSQFADPEIVFRLKMKQHIGLVVASESPARVEELLRDYTQRIARDYLMVLPPAERAAH
jgi:hypothetical protein